MVVTDLTERSGRITKDRFLLVNLSNNEPDCFNVFPFQLVPVRMPSKILTKSSTIALFLHLLEAEHQEENCFFLVSGRTELLQSQNLVCSNCFLRFLCLQH